MRPKYDRGRNRQFSYMAPDGDITTRLSKPLLVSGT
jgi:hypothetical protein